MCLQAGARLRVRRKQQLAASTERFCEHACGSSVSYACFLL